MCSYKGFIDSDLWYLMQKFEVSSAGLNLSTYVEYFKCLSKLNQRSFSRLGFVNLCTVL